MTDSPPTLTSDEVQRFADIAARLTSNVSSVILGKPEVVKLALTGLFAEGHLLLEDVPGVGKTTLARAIAASVRGEWRRIQFTPDLLPSDVSGVTIFNQGTRAVRVPRWTGLRQHRGRRRDQPGLAEDPVIAARGDGGATRHGGRSSARRAPAVPRCGDPEPGRDGRHLPAARGAAGPVPDEDLDRLPGGVGRGPGAARVPPPAARPTTSARSPTPTRVAQLIRLSHRVYVADALYTYAVRLAAATRDHKQVRIGVSPRGVIALSRAAQAYALMDGRAYVVPEDLKSLVQPVFAHRLLLAPDAAMRGDHLRPRCCGRSSRRCRRRHRPPPGPDRCGSPRAATVCWSPAYCCWRPDSGSATRSWRRWAAPRWSPLPARSAFVAWRPRLDSGPGRRSRPGHAGRAERRGAVASPTRAGSSGPAWSLGTGCRPGGTGRRCPLVRLRPGKTTDVRYPVPTRKRGIIQVGPLEISRRDPLGLVGVVRRYGEQCAGLGTAAGPHHRGGAGRSVAQHGRPGRPGAARQHHLRRAAGVRGRRRPATRALADLGPGRRADGARACGYVAAPGGHPARRPSRGARPGCRR